MPLPQDLHAAKQAHGRPSLALAMLIPCSTLTVLQEVKISMPPGQLERGLRWSMQRMLLLHAQVSSSRALARSFQVEVRLQSDVCVVWLIRELRFWRKAGISQAGSVGTSGQEWGWQGAEAMRSSAGPGKETFAFSTNSALGLLAQARPPRAAIRYYRKRLSFWQDDLLSWDHSQISPHPPVHSRPFLAFCYLKIE